MAEPKARRTLGVIGGSGLYSMPDLTNVEEIKVTTTFGDPSDAVISGFVGDTRLLFLPRHGRGHRFAPHEINYRANILALKQLGAEQLLSITAVGSMKEHIVPGHMVVVDQYIDRTRNRKSTYFEGLGVVGHVAFSEPTDAALRAALYESAKAAGATVHTPGTYICIDGPQFSTKAESLMYRSWGVDVIGMTNLPEVKLAREAELPFAALALATDYDAWHDSHDAVTVEAVVEVMSRNVAKAQQTIREIATRLPDPAKSPATSALKNAIMTDFKTISAEAREKLKPITGKYLG